MTDDQRPDELPGPPEFTEIEQQLLGIVLRKPRLFDAVAELVASEHFVEEAYGRVWGVFHAMWRRDIPLSPSSALEPIVDELGWARGDTVKLLTHLMGLPTVATLDQARYLATMVRDVWQRREIWDLGHAMIRRTQGGLDNDAAKIIAEAEAKLYDVAARNAITDEHSLSFSDAIAKGLEQAQAASQQHADGLLMGAPSGLAVVDKKLGGFRDTDFIIIGARPGMGKTAMANRIASAAARAFVSANPERPAWVYFASMEMNAEQLALRQVSAEARISFERIRLGYTDTDEMIRLEDAGKAIRDLPILIDDTARVTVPALRTRVKRLARKHGRVGLIILDYLQLLASDEKNENRVQELSGITRGLKGLAKDLNVPVLALAQLSRAVELREDKRPQLSDLRDSGSLEMDADLVLFLYRQVYYLSKQKPQKRDRDSDLDHSQRVVEWQIQCDGIRTIAELIVAKNRHGSEGTLLLKFIDTLMLFEDDTLGGAGGEDQERRKQQLAMELDNRIV